MKLLAAVVMLNIFIIARAKGPDACSTVDPNTRVDCGFYGINSANCTKKGCCWDASVQNVSYCFNKPNASAPDYKACSSRNPYQRSDCGFYGITQTVCNGKGCCYDNTFDGGVPWCFHKPDINSPDYETCSARDPDLRVDCGTYGIDKPHCNDKGCCYDNSIGGGVPWCFNKPDTSSPDYEICSSVDHTRRAECGWLGITKDQCLDRRCCYDDSTKGAKYCFNKPDTSAPDYEICSKVDPYQRVDCGWYGITRDQCHDNGCCYDNTLDGLPWCFNKPDVNTPKECSAVAPAARKDCGYLGINKEQCLDRGCCYDNTVRDSPWCFHNATLVEDNVSADDLTSKPDACSTVVAKTRVDCGFYGINSTNCTQKGCCWDESIEDVPYCFNKPNTAAPDYEACSSRNPYQRVDCGFYGINQTVCNGKGCCYDNTVGGGVPWCFNKPDTNSSDYVACSSRDPNLRVECGFYGINKTQCQGKGCCYDNSVGGGVRWCFNKPDTSSPDYEICSSVDHSRRVECGWFGITKDQCLGRRCCYDDSTNGAKYCFNKPDTSSPDYEICSEADPYQRVDCGWYGINRDQCQARGCCYDNTLDGLAWCFNKPDAHAPAECTAVEPADREDCGYYGINREECVDRECCYDNTVRDYPWCFHKKPAV